MQRPASVTIFGILNIIFAVFGVLGTFGRLHLFVNMETSANLVVKIMRENPGYATWMKAMIPLGLLGCGVLLASGFGLLKLKEWGRKASIGYAIYEIVAGLLGGAVNFVFVFLPLLEASSHQHDPEAIGVMFVAVGTTAIGIFGMIYPILLILFMTRPKVVQAFRLPTP